MARKSKEAHREYERNYYQQVDKPKRAIRTRNWKMKNQEDVLNKYYLRHYGITYAQYQQLLERQGGVCAICLRPQDPSGKTKRLAVDHDHKTRKIRGLLHSWSCNRRLLGNYSDPNLFRRAANYLENPPAKDLFPNVTVPVRKRKRSEKVSST